MMSSNLNTTDRSKIQNEFKIDQRKGHESSRFQHRNIICLSKQSLFYCFQIEEEVRKQLCKILKIKSNV